MGTGATGPGETGPDTESTDPHTTAGLTPPLTTTIAGAEATAALPGEDLPGVPHLPWGDETGVRLPFVEVPDPRAMLVEPSPGDPRPALSPGDVVDNRYEVLGCLAHGGLGWVYLAWDRELDGHIALKGLLDPTRTRVADAERRALTELHHQNIVRIFGFVWHPDRETGTPYIVMEYVGGLSLRAMLQRIAAGEEPLGTPLRAEHVIGYGLEILKAFHYLHSRDLLFCDMKPDNVVHGDTRIKIIDLGATRGVDDHSPIYITKHYQVPREEQRRCGLTVRADLHTVGVTLREVLEASEDNAATPGDGGIGFGVESLRHVLDRARNTYERRFISASDMAGHLYGVLREIQSLRDGAPRPPTSSVFAQTAALADVGLGTVPALDRWTARPAAAYETPPLDDGMPEPAELALLLPAPRVDPRDEAVAFLGGVRAPDARGLLRQLSRAPEESVEVELARCRAHLELASPSAAAQCVAAAERLLGADAEHDWRLAWHRGLLALAEGHVAETHTRFDAVYRALAGESTPKLALGYCHEHARDHASALEFYHAVWQRDRDQAGAAFGLARLRLADGDRAGAVRVLDQVPEVSLHYQAARIAAVRVLAGRLDTHGTQDTHGTPGLPSAAELDEALERLWRLDLEGDDETGTHGPARERLTAEVRENQLNLAIATGEKELQRDLREQLEQSIRALAHQAHDAEDHGVLTDLANAVRPKTRF